MIECTPNRIYKRKKYRKTRFRRFKVFFLVFIILISLYLYYRNVVFSEIRKICIEQSRAYAAEAVNEGVLISLSDKINYNDIMHVEKNESGDVVMMSADTFKVNYINKSVAKNSELFLKDKLQKGVPIPLMAFSGISFLSGYGNAVDYKAVSVSSTTSKFVSEFKSVGINQTKHSIYVNVKCRVSIYAPLVTAEDEFNSSVLICETILVGKVPEIYLNGKIFS